MAPSLPPPAGSRYQAARSQPYHVLLRHRPRSCSLSAGHFLAVVRDIGIVVSYHRVVPVAAEDGVVGVPVVVSNLIVAVAADNPIAVSTVRITPLTLSDEVVRATTAVDAVAANVPAYLVARAPAMEVIPRPPPVDGVRASSSADNILVLAAVESIRVSISADLVVSHTAADEVAPCAAVENVKAVLSIEAVPPCPSRQGVAAPTAAKEISSGGSSEVASLLAALQSLPVRVAPGRVLSRRDRVHGGVGGRCRDDHHDCYDGEQASRHRARIVHGATGDVGTPRGRPATPASLRHRPRAGGGFGTKAGEAKDAPGGSPCKKLNL